MIPRLNQNDPKQVKTALEAKNKIQSDPKQDKITQKTDPN